MNPKRKISQETLEVGDLFVTEHSIMLKLLPSRKAGSLSIRWFDGGGVTDVRRAAKDIQCLVGRLRGRSCVVRGLTVMTDKGRATDLVASRLDEAVRKAGFEVLA